MTARGTLVGSKYPNQLLHTRWEMWLSSNEILKRARLPSVEVTMLQHRLRWAGHVVRMDPSRLPRITLCGKLNEGTKPHGRPKLRYKDQLKCSLRQACINLQSWEQLVLIIQMNICNESKIIVKHNILLRVSTLLHEFVNVKINCWRFRNGSNFPSQKFVCVRASHGAVAAQKYWYHL